MAVPKKRHTKSARNQRRSHQKLSKPTITKCSMCKSPKKPHHICEVCGSYKKRRVVEKKTVSKKSTAKK
ncbi:50S ribosomal protein L32 [Patescibacteria group bacterium]|nr:50S ribosomal protein L32 [Patescibacteria group bacterium]